MRSNVREIKLEKVQTFTVRMHVQQGVENMFPQCHYGTSHLFWIKETTG